MAPPIPAMKAARPATSSFIWSTLIPRVLDPGSLQRTAFSAIPVVDRRRLTTMMAMTANTARDR